MKKIDWYSVKFLLPLFLFITFFFPPITSKGIFWGSESGEVTARVLIAVAGRDIGVAAGTHVFFVVILILLMKYGNRVRYLFNAFAAGDYILISFLQSIAILEDYGLSILTTNIAVFLLVSAVWVKEVFEAQNDFAFRKLPSWRYWTIPFAFLAFWFPAKPSGEADFNPIYLLTSDFGVAFCLTTPVVVAILTLIYPHLNEKVLKITCTAGVLYGVYNLQIPFFEPRAWWVNGVLHIPLFSISLYGLILPKILKKQ